MSSLTTLLSSLLLALAVLAAGSIAHAQGSPPVAAAAMAPAAADGEVRKVDADAQKITLRHGPIENLEMPAMTMVFRVSDPTMLQSVKVGDKVRFKADKVGGQFTVVDIQVVR